MFLWVKFVEKSLSGEPGLDEMMIKVLQETGRDGVDMIHTA
jgi:hypothetical protein